MDFDEGKLKELDEQLIDPRIFLFSIRTLRLMKLNVINLGHVE